MANGGFNQMESVRVPCCVDNLGIILRIPASEHNMEVYRFRDFLVKPRIWNLQA